MNMRTLRSVVTAACVAAAMCGMSGIAAYAAEGDAAPRAKAKTAAKPRRHFGHPDATVARDRLQMQNKRTKQLWWKERHEAKLAEIAASGGKYDLVLLGDSITHRWDRPGFGTNVLARLEKKYKVLDIGYGADHTEQVLWRITEGRELDGYKARVVALMIGTNNSRGYKPENVAAGIKKIVDIIREKQPEAKIVLTAILPRYGDSDEKKKMRANNDAVNAIIKDYADGKNVFWLDMNPKFPPLDGDWKAVCPDGTHPIEPGYEIWAAELEPYLAK